MAQGFAAFRASLGPAMADLRARLHSRPIRTLNTTGKAAVTGTLREPDRPRTTLTFSFESDQTFMRRTVDALNEVTQQFPVRAVGG